MKKSAKVCVCIMRETGIGQLDPIPVQYRKGYKIVSITQGVDTYPENDSWRVDADHIRWNLFAPNPWRGSTYYVTFEKVVDVEQ